MPFDEGKGIVVSGLLACVMLTSQFKPYSIYDIYIYIDCICVIYLTYISQVLLPGSWEIHTGEPMWVWTYEHGQKEEVSAVAIAVEATYHKDADVHLQQAELKVDQIHKVLGLPVMEPYKLRAKVSSWISLQG